MLKKLLSDEKGISTIEIAIITAVLLSLALIFRKQMLSFCNALTEKLFP